MKTLGIIAEYNPFHNGHLYQIQKAKELTNADCVVVVMSGDFVQRGAPAWTDKYLRTQMALQSQADLVFEIPAVYAVSSAEAFALAGVSLLTSLGFVDTLCFGSECGDLTSLQKVADFLLQPPRDFYTAITSYTASGLTFPLARKQAFLDCYTDTDTNPSPFTDSGNALASLLDSPNNILAIEYLKALQVCHSHLQPITIKRSDAGYHDTHLDAHTQLASASAIRQCFYDTSSFKHTQLVKAPLKRTPSVVNDLTISNTDSLSQIQSYFPAAVYSLLQKEKNRFPVTENDFSTLLYYRLCHLSDSDKDILDLSDELFYRIQKECSSYTDYRSFIEKVKTKQYTYTRVSRVLLHLLLNITKTDICSITSGSSPFVPYARLLGFSKEKSAYLRYDTKIPVITKPADGMTQICDFYNSNDPSYIQSACTLYQKDLFASNLYSRVQSHVLGCTLTDEYRQKPVIIS